MPNNHPIQLFLQAIKKIRDPRSKRGVTHDFHSILAILFLGLLANVSTLAEIERWAKRQFLQLKKFIPFKRNRTPSDNTFARALQSLTISDLHAVFAEFINAIAANEISVVAVDGKVAKQMNDEDGNPILMLNIFAQKIKLYLTSYSVHGDKTNEPGCLKQHLEELFSMYPTIQILTGDAIFAQRPLLEALREYNRDYLFQVKDNQGRVFEQLKLLFDNVKKRETDNQQSQKNLRRDSLVVDELLCC